MNSSIGRSLVWDSIRGATLLELIAVLATASSFYSLVNQIGYRIFLRQEGVSFPTSQLMASLFAFVVCAAALGGILYLRQRLDAEEAPLAAAADFED